MNTAYDRVPDIPVLISNIWLAYTFSMNKVHLPFCRIIKLNTFFFRCYFQQQKLVIHWEFDTRSRLKLYRECARYKINFAGKLKQFFDRVDSADALHFLKINNIILKLIIESISLVSPKYYCSVYRYGSRSLRRVIWI